MSDCILSRAVCGYVCKWLASFLDLPYFCSSFCVQYNKYTEAEEWQNQGNNCHVWWMNRVWLFYAVKLTIFNLVNNCLALECSTMSSLNVDDTPSPLPPPLSPSPSHFHLDANYMINVPCFCSSSTSDPFITLNTNQELMSTVWWFISSCTNQRAKNINGGGMGTRVLIHM